MTGSDFRSTPSAWTAASSFGPRRRLARYQSQRRERATREAIGRGVAAGANESCETAMIGVFIAGFVCGVGATQEVRIACGKYLKLGGDTVMTDKDGEYADYLRRKAEREEWNGLKLICREITSSHVATFSNRQF